MDEPRTAPASGPRVSWVVAAVGLTLATYCLAVVVPYSAAGPGSPDGAWGSGPAWLIALLAVQVAPLVALVAGPWALWTGAVALRRGREEVAVMAGACVVLCATLAGLSLSPAGLALLAVLMD